MSFFYIHLILIRIPFWKQVRQNVQHLWDFCKYGTKPESVKGSFKVNTIDPFHFVYTQCVVLYYVLTKPWI